MHSNTLGDTVDQIQAFYRSQHKSVLRIATPLGLGKPNQLINEVYRRFCADPSQHLEIYTALSLDPPSPRSDFEKRFMQTFADRHFGADYPVLQYVRDLKRNTLPSHIRIHEFYIEAGAYKSNTTMQSHYASINYTQVVRNLVACEVEVILLQVAKRENRYSLSSNPDLTLDLVDELRAAGRAFMVVAAVHPELPFIGGDAEVPADFFDLVLESPEIQHKLFAVPRQAIDATDFMIGLHASRLVPDDGTLQIGIGSLSDAVVYSLIQRHRNNAVYRQLMHDMPLLPPSENHIEPFQKGLYGTSEMVMDGFMHLRKAGILSRLVPNLYQRNYLEGAFFLGSQTFYDWLRQLDGDDFNGFSMTRVSRVNNLFDRHDRSSRAERQNARFFNTCMNVTLLGGAASDTLVDGRVVSGVGGQYNFVAMAHELSDAHSILMLRSTSFRDGRLHSNIVGSHGHLTIPRHLRDVVITEYGIAFLRGRTDAEVSSRLVEIADSAFQDELVEIAVASGKLPSSYRVPDHARSNTAASISLRMNRYRRDFSLFPEFPFGSDFTPEELRLGKALLHLKSSSLYGKLQALILGFCRDPQDFAQELQRMGLSQSPQGRERLLSRLLMGALVKSHSH